jgi:hypothetical protein
MQQATTIFARLTEVEKIHLRRATPGVIGYLADTHYLVDMPNLPFDEREKVLTEVQAIAKLAFAANSAREDFSKTWTF